MSVNVGGLLSNILPFLASSGCHFWPLSGGNKDQYSLYSVSIKCSEAVGWFLVCHLLCCCNRDHIVRVVKSHDFRIWHTESFTNFIRWKIRWECYDACSIFQYRIYPSAYNVKFSFVCGLYSESSNSLLESLYCKSGLVHVIYRGTW